MAAVGVSTSLWWDMERCPLPSYVDPYIVASMAPALLHNFNIITSMVNAGGDHSSLGHHQFSAYELFSETQTELDQMLLNSGIGLHQLPPGQTSNEMEKMMMADVLLWAMDTPPPANIIFIIGNVDLCYVFQKLRQRSYNVFLVCQSMSEMPQGMLAGVNDCLGWLSFLRSLQIEDQQSHFPGGVNVYDHTFSNTAFPASSASIHNREIEESSNASVIKYSRENLLSLRHSLSDGWYRTCNFPIDETAGSSPVWREPGFYGHFIRTKKPRSPVSSASFTEKNKSASLEEFKAWLTLVVNSKDHAENGYDIWPIRMDFQKATGKILDEKLLGFSDIRNLVEECKDIAVLKEVQRGCHLAFPFELSTQKNQVQTEPGFRGHFISTERPRSSVSSASSTENKESGSLEEFRSWLAQVINSIEHAENGYDISHIHMDFEKATGKILDKTLLGFPKIRNLVEECKDIAVLKEVKQGCHFAFPLEPTTQNNPVSSPGGVNQNLSPELKPKAETDPKPKQKASADDFREFIYQMLLSGEFSQGFVLGCLRLKFEEQTGKVLDVKHLGYKKLSRLVESYSHLVSVDNAGTVFCRIFPAGFVSEALPSNPNSNTTSKVTSMNTNHDPTKLEAKIEEECPSSGVRDKELLENSVGDENIHIQQFPSMNSESKWLPSMTTGSPSLVSLSLYREVNSPAFPEYNSIRSNSSSTPAGTEVSEREDQYSNTISDMTSFHGELNGSDFIKQHVSTLQLESNDPIEDSVNAECLMAEAMQNMRPMKENTNICGEPSIHACTLGFPDWNPPPSESPSSVPQAGGNSPLVDPLQSRSRAESGAFCAEDLRCRIRLDCKQNELNAQKNPVFSQDSVNQNLSPELKPKAETDPKLKLKASAEDFREFINQMLLSGEFSQGFVLGRLRLKFEEQTGKVLDVKHLGYKKLSRLVESYSHLVSVDNAGTVFCRIFPAGFVSEALPSNPNSNTTSKVTSMNTNHDPTKLKAKIEEDCPSSGVNDKELLENSVRDKIINIQQFPSMNSESKWLPSMTTGSQASVSFSPYREADSPAFQEYNSIRSNSSSTPGGAQVSEREGQSSNTISDMTSFHGELKGSNFIKQHISTLQWESNDPIEDSVNAECLVAEAMQNMSLMKENANFCGEPSIHGCILGLPDWDPPLTNSPSSVPQASCKSPLADPLQSSRAESSAFCAEDSKYGIRLDCKQNELSTQKSPVYSPGGMDGNLSPEFKPKAETDPELKQKASAEDFREFIYQMLLAGEFPQGFELGRLHHKFEEKTGKVLDVKHLGYKKLSKLVASYSHLLSVNNAGTELEESDFIKQHFSTLQLESNDPMEDTVNAKCLIAEAMQNMSLMKENAIFCGETSIHACTLGLPDWNPPQFKFASPEPQAGCNSPLADPLQSTSRAESSAFCAEDSRYGISLACKQNELNTQKNPVCSPGGMDRNLGPEFKPKAETDPKLKQKASAEEFREFIYQMLLAGEFSQGFVLGRLRHKFEEKTGKVLDVKHLGFKKLSKLVASYSHILSVDNAGTEFSRIFPAGYVSEVVPSNPNSKTTSKITSMNNNHDPAKLKAKVEADCPLSGVSGKELLENKAWDENIYIQQFPYMNSESEWLPDMTTGLRAPESFSPRQANSPTFQERGIKSDSASTPGGFKFSECEGQSYTTINETAFFNGEGSDFINLVLALQRDGNIPIEDSVIVKRLIVEAMENRKLIIENKSFCREPSIPAGAELPDSFPVLNDSPSPELQAGYISPPAPLQRKAESNAACAEDLRDSIRLDCKQNEQSTRSGGDEERSIRMPSAVSSVGSIIQVAGKGLKSFCELTMWRKNL